MSRFRFGQIILAYMSDGQGRTKERPAVVISGEQELKEGEYLSVVAITKSFNRPCPAYHIPMPWKPNGHPETGLNLPGVAKCNWIRRVPIRKVIKSLGDAPDDELGRILDQVGFIEANPHLKF